ncbi:MAG: hypothetical protein NVSMB1_07870 [Polyangiales bacterium]
MILRYEYGYSVAALLALTSVAAIASACSKFESPYCTRNPTDPACMDDAADGATAVADAADAPSEGSNDDGDAGSIDGGADVATRVGHRRLHEERFPLRWPEWQRITAVLRRYRSVGIFHALV